jgi:FlaA1/EpsC-like NDP-sugar epimerase
VTRLLAPPARRRSLVLLVHVGLMAAAYLGAFLLRFEFVIPEAVAPVMWLGLPIFIACRVPFLVGFRLTAGWWRYVSVSDLVRIVQALSLGTLCAMAVGMVVLPRFGFPRSVFALEWALSLLLIGGARLSVRLAREVGERPDDEAARRLLVVGAGDAAELILREIRKNAAMHLRPVALVDDDPAKRGMELHGVPVLGRCDEIPGVAARLRAQDVLIAIPSATGREVRRILDLCNLAEPRPRVHILPALTELLDGRVTVDQIRKVELEDLLGREPVRVDLGRIRAEIAGRAVLVSGAGGSVGSELCRQILALEPARLVLLERSENHLWEVDHDLRRRFPGARTVPLVADAGALETVRAALVEHQVDVVFHAAAMKHVPIAEANPFETVANNVFGTEAMVRAALHADVSRFVFISTDKVVRPRGLMGASKRLGERLVAAANSERESFVSVRFGNVLGSSGSVVPIFRRQIADGGPVTVTHPDATRYFMTLREAVQLVLQAAAYAAGHTFLLNMGEPVRVMDLARRLIELSGRRPDVDVAIAVVGLRPGEKLHEQLTADDEIARPTDHEKIFAVRAGAEPLEDLRRRMAPLRAAVERRNRFALVTALHELVPDYEPEGFAAQASADRSSRIT